MSSYIDIYRKKTRSTKCDNRSKNNLIADAIGNTKVFHRRKGLDIECNLIIKNKNEGHGTAIIYTFAKDDLQVGDYFIWNNKYVFLVTDEDNNVALDANIKKFNARECNIIFKYGTKEEWESGSPHSQNATFIGKSSTRINTSIDSSSEAPRVNAYDESIMIFSGVEIPRFESVKIFDSQWTVLDWDCITARPIVYATIKEVPVTQNEKTSKKANLKNKNENSSNSYRSGVRYEFDTEDFYFKSDSIDPISRLQNKVIIEMPYNTKKIKFNIKEKGKIMTRTIEIED